MAPLTCSKRKPVEYTIFLLSPRCSFPFYPVHLPRTIASSPLSPLRQPANYHLLSINQIRGVFNPLLQRFPGVHAVHSVEGKGVRAKWSSSPRTEASMLGSNNQKAAFAAGICNVATSLFFPPTINCLQWTRHQTRRFTLLSRAEILLFKIFLMGQQLLRCAGRLSHLTIFP